MISTSSNKIDEIVVPDEIETYVSMPSCLLQGCSNDLIIFRADGGNHFTHYGIYEGMFLIFDVSKDFKDGHLSCYLNNSGDDRPKFKVSDKPLDGYRHFGKLLELRERLKEYTGFDYSVIPESIVEAFIEHIWVSKDEFRWYLRTGNNADSEFDPDDHIKIGAFTLTIDDAKKYIYSFSTRRRVYKWVDLKVSVWI